MHEKVGAGSRGMDGAEMMNDVILSALIGIAILYGLIVNRFIIYFHIATGSLFAGLLGAIFGGAIWHIEDYPFMLVALYIAAVVSGCLSWAFADDYKVYKREGGKKSRAAHFLDDGLPIGLE